jgi:integrase
MPLADRGVHTPARASITVAEAADIWLEKGELERLQRSGQYENHVDPHIEPLRIGPRSWHDCLRR